MVYVQ